MKQEYDKINRPDMKAVKGRGATSNPHNRFGGPEHEKFDDGWWLEEEEDSPKTTILPDKSRSVLSRHTSPDLGHCQRSIPTAGANMAASIASRAQPITSLVFRPAWILRLAYLRSMTLCLCYVVSYRIDRIVCARSCWVL